MATEYKLSYTAAQINEKLGKIDNIDEQIVVAVADYLTENPIEGGMTKAEKDLILELFRNAAYTSADMNSKLNQLETLWSGSGGDIHTHSYTSTITTAATCTTDGVRTYICGCGHSYTESIAATGHNYVDGICTSCGAADPNYSTDEPDVPVEPEVTLTSISATYSGGDVAVGTAVSSLSGIVVTAQYSDGSTTTVTDYTMSGTIAEGSNIVTVTYQGKTTTFSVVGVAESSGGGVVNLFDKNTMVVTGAFVASGGAISTSATSKYANIPISTGTYALQKGSGWGMSTTGHPSLCDAEGNVLCAFNNLQASGAGGSTNNASIGTIARANGNNGIAVTVLSDTVAYIRFSIRVNGGTDDTDTTMMEIGDTCHDYVAYE